MLFRVLDIETVPDLSVWTPGPAKWRPRPGVGGKPQALYMENVGNGQQEMSPCSVVYEREEPFSPPQANRVVAVAWCDVLLVNQAGRPKTYDFQGSSTCCMWGKDDDEAELLWAFRRVMVDHQATLVTWNGRGFDLPVLAMRALHHGVPWGWYYDSRDIRYRYTDEGHCDLMDYLSDFGASRSMKLDDFCRLIGLPGKAASGEGEEHLDGSRVAELVARCPTDQRAMERVGRYCLQDVLQTAISFVRTRHHLEILDDSGYMTSVATFRDSAAVQDAIKVDWDRVLSLGGRRP